ncbi:hypothetical protein QBC47DRAFT_412390 [Echria macrotheca]|uniref:Uncharacterized protein n=1 Tax=Echria macrotheca TaxID=438768 RepID=A0AAJ0FB63_9PEZI|nr:hypothetical protein QBC47DRAFT_412390 [Echria macrotheca]
MSGLYYVFVKYLPADKVQATNWGRLMLCFPSRYDADEFYRALQGIPQIVGLVRSSAQFWGHSSRGWDQIHLVQSLGLVEGFRNVISTVLLNDGLAGGRAFPLITNPVPSFYWFVHDDHIHTSEDRRTKFCVELAVPTSGAVQAMIRDDEVMVSVITETTTSAAVMKDGKKYLAVVEGRLLLSATRYLWTFRDLVCGRIGVRWEPDPMVVDSDDDSVDEEETPFHSRRAQTAPRPLLVYMAGTGGDEWELC